MKNLSLFIIAIQVFVSSLSGQTVSTITAGNFTDGLGIDHLGNVYCSDWGGNTVYKLDTNGNVSTFKNGFSNPNGIAVDDTNQIYICDHTANRIFKYDTAGTQLASYTGFVSPAGIKKLPNSPNFIVVEYNTGRVKILEPNGTVTQMRSGSPLNGPAGIAIIDTTVYIANFNNRQIYRLNSNYSLSLIVQLPSHAGGVYNAVGFLTAMHGKLYATHISGNRIYEIDPSTSTASVFAGSAVGGQDGPVATATFNQPNGILADPPNNRLYVSDAGLKNLRIIDNLVVSTPEISLQKLSLEVFPNPVKSLLNIRVPELKSSEVDISISNMMGQEIQRGTVSVNNHLIQLNLKDSLFPSGNYIVSLRNNNTIASKLFVVE